MSNMESEKENVRSSNEALNSGDSSNEILEKSADTDKDSGELPTELLVKHPLQSRWCLWYLKADRNKDWEDCLKEVTTFDTVEDFWALYNHIQVSSGLNWGSDYYLFKEGIKPMWEDEKNKAGGRWLVVMDKSKRNELLDHYWLELLMAMIGEQFEEHGEQICGSVVNVRQKGDKVSLWTRDAAKDDVNKRIGQILKAKLDIPDSDPIRYEVHKDSSSKSGSTVKARLNLPERKDAPNKY